MSSQFAVYTSTLIFVRNFRVNMVTAIAWCSHTTHYWIWLLDCFGLNGPLRQNFSLNRAVSQRGRKKREKIDERKNVQTIPTRSYCKRNRSRPRGYKTFIVLNSVEHEILNAHKYKNIKKFGIFKVHVSLECYFSRSYMVK